MNRFVLIIYVILPFVGLTQTNEAASWFGSDAAAYNYYQPSGLANQVIQHKGYSLSYNEAAEQADWVFYKLTSASFSSPVERTNDYREDTLVAEGSAELSDYSGSGYDRGHLAPAGSMKSDEESMSHSFFMSNMSPQLPAFNRGVWRRLEEKVRYWVESYDSVFVTTGPVFDDPLDSIGVNKVIVPRSYYKTLLTFKNEKASGIAFIVAHEESDNSLYSFATSIDSVEVITGIDCYSRLDSVVQDRVERNGSVKVFLYD